MSSVTLARSDFFILRPSMLSAHWRRSALMPSRSVSACSKARSSASTSMSRSAAVVLGATTGRLFFGVAIECDCMVMAVSPSACDGGGHDVAVGVLLLQRHEPQGQLGRRDRGHIALEAGAQLLDLAGDRRVVGLPGGEL